MPQIDYTISGIPLSRYGFSAGVIDGKCNGYDLSGIWSLPKRGGKTHYDWGIGGGNLGGVEPYTDSDDIVFREREFQLSIVALCANLGELRTKVDTLYSAIGDSFTLAHSLLGSYSVRLDKIDLSAYHNGWGQATLKLRELTPLLLSDLTRLPEKTTPAKDGIDGYTWSELGLVVSDLANRYDLPQFAPLNLTASSHAIGARAPRTITLEGTLLATTYADFQAKADRLRSLIGRAGMRSIKYFDGSTLTAFCIDGMAVNDVIKFRENCHWGQITCKMITI
ncbi:MAG: hypothetical protein RR689_02890 [Mucinivorans sp.]